jgi:hypothetical protein
MSPPGSEDRARFFKGTRTERRVGPPTQFLASLKIDYRGPLEQRLQEFILVEEWQSQI